MTYNWKKRTHYGAWRRWQKIAEKYRMKKELTPHEQKRYAKARAAMYELDLALVLSGRSQSA